jgi:type IV secretory pathway VirB2 component (pilin)
MWQIGWLLVVLGVIGICLAVLADPLGIGSTGGWRQILLVVVGVVVVIVGAAIARRAATTQGLRE